MSTCNAQSRAGRHQPRRSHPPSSSMMRYHPPSWWDSSLAWRTWRAHDGRPRRGILSRAVALRYLSTQSQSKWYARLAMTLRARAEAMVRRRRSRRGGCWAQLAEKWYARGLVGARKQTQIPGASLSGELGFATVPSRILSYAPPRYPISFSALCHVVRHRASRAANTPPAWAHPSGWQWDLLSRRHREGQSHRCSLLLWICLSFRSLFTVDL